MPESEDALIADHNARTDFVLGLIFLSCLLLVCVDFVLAVLIRDESLSISLLLVMAGIFGVGLFGWLSQWYFLAIFKNKPALMITHEGIYDNSEPWSPGLVYWSEIKGIKKRRILFWKVVVIELHNRDGVISRQKNIFKRSLFKKNWFPINLPDEIYIRLNTITNPIFASLLSHIDKNRRNTSFFLE